MKKISTVVSGALLSLMVLSGISMIISPARAALTTVSPTLDPNNGFPLWYQDANGLQLELCKDPADPLCLADPVVPGNAFSERTGFGGEAFYWMGESIIDLNGGGQALLVMALESAYAAENPAPGDQMVFSRIRIRIDAPVAGTYTVTHPFGSKTYTVTTPGLRAINDTIDIGAVPISASPTAFQAALNGNVGPFLTAVNPPAAPGYVGTPLVEQTVTGSPTGNNFFRVQGPAGANLGGQGVNTVTKDTFILSGKVFVPPVATLPTITVDPLLTQQTTPTITGIVSDPAATVTVQVGGQQIAATVTANGTWSAKVLQPLANGAYDVVATATNASGQGVDTSTSELTIDTTIPVSTLGLQAVSSTVHPVNGFPNWYQDANGVSLQLCSDPNDGLCLADPVVPGNPTSEQNGFGGEAFYWNAGSTQPIAGGGSADLVLSLEGAYAGGDPNPGDQMVFTRVRVRIDAPVAGNYTITHPFGTKTYTVDTPGVGAINETLDLGAVPIGLTPDAFSLALNGNIGPFLTAVTPAPPAGYIGSPAITQTVTGSPLGNNFFRVQGPVTADLDGAGNNTITTDQFTLSGKLFAPAISAISINPPTATVNVGATQQLTAEGQDQTGSPIPVTATWSNADPAVGSIDPNTGVYTALASGTDTITATSGTFTATATITVTVPTDPQLATLSIVPNAPTIQTGASQQFSVIGLDQAGNPIPNLVVTWSNADPLIGSIDLNGLYTATAAGVDTVTATSGTVSATTQVTVTPVEQVLTTVNVLPANPVLSAGTTQPFTAETLDQFGNPITATISWTNLNAVTGIIPTSTGLYTALAAGSDTVIALATANGISVSGTTGVTVTEEVPVPVLTSVTITPGNTTTNVGSTTNFTAQPLDEIGAPITATLSWSNANPALGTINPITGTYTALSAGTDTITVTATDGTTTVTNTTTITITDTPAPVLTTVLITPEFANLFTGNTLQFSAQTLDQNGAPIDATINWSNLAPTTGLLSPTGLYTALAAGEDTVTALATDANNNTVSATVLVTVTDPENPPVPTTLTITPVNPQINFGGTTTFIANVADQFGNPMNEPVTWSVEDPTVGTIDETGLFTALTAGSTLVTATSGTLEASTTVTVTEETTPVLNQVVITPGTVLLAPGETQQFTATTTDTTGNPIAATIVWSNITPTTGEIDPATGLYTALATGPDQVTATATANGITVFAAAPIVVQEIPPVPTLTHVDISPLNSQTLIGETVEFSANPLDQAGNPIAAELSWSNQNPTIGSIDPITGVYTALSAGLDTVTITATAGEITVTNFTTITVTEEQVEPIPTSLTISPLNPSISINGTQQFTAEVLDQNGQPMVDELIEWSVADETIGTITDTGLFTALKAGTTDVTATSGTLSATTTITVLEENVPVLTDVELKPTQAALKVGETITFTAEPKDQNDEPIEATLSWTNANSELGTIDPVTGIYEALAPGTDTITVTAEAGEISVTTTAEIVITEEPVTTEPASITIYLKSVKVNIGKTMQLTAKVKDQNGILIPEAPITWSVADNAIGTIDQTGLFTGISLGTVKVTATSGAATASVSILVKEDTVHEPTTIEFTAPDTTMTEGETQQLSATVLDERGRPMEDAVVSWTSSQTTVGTISNTGLFTAKDDGTTTITATSGAATKSVTITVKAADTNQPPAGGDPQNPIDTAPTDDGDIIKDVKISKRTKKGAVLTYRTTISVPTKVMMSGSRKHVSSKYFKKKKYRKAFVDNNTKEHTVVFSRLDNNERYYYRILIEKPNGEKVYSDILHFKTK